MHRIGRFGRKLAGLLLACALATAPGCGDKRDQPAKPPAEQPAPPADDAAPEGLTAAGLSGHHREDAKWVPGEYKKGGRRWRDAGVYVDGVPHGVLWFGELPAALEPVFLEQEADTEYRAGDLGPRTKLIKVRRYRLAEYLEAVGVDLKKVKQVQIYGGKGFPAVIDGKELRRVRDTLYFAFGRETAGKPLIYMPADLKVNTSFDHIAAVAVYIDKKPPKLRDDGDLELDGKVVYDIPYYGEPLRGGVRVYKDDRLAVTIKRRKLEASDDIVDKRPDGALHWKLLPYLASQGVAVDDVARADVIYDERRVKTLDRAALETAFFTANPQASGQIQLGGDTPVQALALHSK